MKKLFLLLTVCGALAACETTEQALRKEGKKPLTAVQIRQAFIGNTLAGTSKRGPRFALFYRKNGTLSVLYTGSRDTGTWRITKPGTLCFRYTSLFRGREFCGRYYKLAPNNYQHIKIDGSAVSTFKVFKGNPKKL